MSRSCSVHNEVFAIVPETPHPHIVPMVICVYDVIRMPSNIFVVASHIWFKVACVVLYTCVFWTVVRGINAVDSEENVRGV